MQACFLLGTQFFAGRHPGRLLPDALTRGQHLALPAAAQPAGPHAHGGPQAHGLAGVGGHQSRRRTQHLFRPCTAPAGHGQRTGDVGQVDLGIVLAQYRVQGLVVGTGAADGQPVVPAVLLRPELPPQIGEFEGPRVGLGPAGEHGPVAAGILLVRQAATAAGRGDLGQLVLFGQFQLVLAAAPADAQQTGTVHEALLLGGGGRQMQGAQGAQQDVLHPGIAADGVEHVPALRHGTLPHDLARGQQARADALHVKAGMAQEQDLAVHAGVHDLAEAVGRTGTQHGAKIVAHVQGADVQPVEVAPALHGAGITEEGGMAVQAADPQALFLQDLGRQDAVQAAGKKHDHIHRPLVSIDHAGRGGGLEIGGSVHHGPPSTRKRGQEARARPGFSQLLDRIFRSAASAGPVQGWGSS